MTGAVDSATTDAVALLARWSKLTEEEVRADRHRAYVLAIRASHPSGGGTVTGYFGVREAGRILGIRGAR